MHGGDGEVRLSHLLCQPLHLSLCVAEDDRLCDGQGVVEVTERVKLPLLLLYGNKELLDALKSQLITEENRLLSNDYFSLSLSNELEVMIPFDKDANGISHKFSCHLQNFMWQGSAHQYHLIVSVLKQMNGWKKIQKDYDKVC